MSDEHERLFQSCAAFAGALTEQMLASGERSLDLSWPDLSGTAFSSVCDAFGLNPFEHWVLYIAACTQLLPGPMLRACAAEFGLYETHESLNAFLCPYVFQQWFGQPDLTAFAPTSVLRGMGLIVARPSSYGQGHELMAQVRISEGALSFLQGSRTLSPEVAQFLTPLQNGAWLGASQQEALAELGQVLGGSSGPQPAPIVNLYCAAPDSALEVAQMYGYGLEAGTGCCWLLDFGALERSVQQEQFSPEAVVGLLHRDLTYLGGTLVIRLDDESDLPGQAQSRLLQLGWSPAVVTAELCRRLQGHIVLISRDPVVQDLVRDLYSVPVTRPTPEEQVSFWGQALGFSDLYLQEAQVAAGLQHLTTQFSLSSHKIQQAARDASRHAAQKYGQKLSLETLMDEVWEACKRRGRKVFQGIAEQIESVAAWDSLVLPPDDLLTLQDIVSQVQHRHRVYRAWGYGVQERGLGITVLFSGTSGGGKTYAAEVLAGALNLDLYRIDLSSVTSKWIGETEKNLKKVFDAADEGGAILLFDEADSVFGKRGDA